MEADHSRKPVRLRQRINSSPGIGARHQDLRRAHEVCVSRRGLSTNNNVDLDSANTVEWTTLIGPDLSRYCVLIGATLLF